MKKSRYDKPVTEKLMWRMTRYTLVWAGSEGHL